MTVHTEHRRSRTAWRDLVNVILIDATVDRRALRCHRPQISDSKVQSWPITSNWLQNDSRSSLHRGNAEIYLIEMPEVAKAIPRLITCVGPGTTPTTFSNLTSAQPIAGNCEITDGGKCTRHYSLGLAASSGVLEGLSNWEARAGKQRMRESPARESRALGSLTGAEFKL
ncbi:hypothetical protein NEOLEDRAFT_1167588 [Neolentinus lepideus HHB14362 ss-1]|uniref:Uncharacterized protein n=1 Tax=Neolentinus lepideus HHB14362 ss-1 TaxID=1314782 RepID=A0A165UJQ8_9AGAM|nr:hypothetical protein NEOLEDRAFT_1167588 [Neolentinus lepideus HHB14362 ss-1]